MKIPKEIRNFQIELSKVNGDFLDYVQANPCALEAENFSLLNLNDKLFVLQPWPTFVNRFYKNQFQDATVKLFDLLKSIPKRIFNYDYKAISNYYNIPGNLSQLLLEGLTDDYLGDLVGRGDFVLGPSGLKCLEYNVTAALGGWYLPMWEALYLETPVISDFIDTYRVKTNNENLIQLFVEHVVGSVVNKNSNNSRLSEINILFIIKDFTKYINTIGVYLNKVLKKIFETRYPGMDGQVMVCDYHHLEITDSQIYFKNKPVHALIEMYNGVVSPEVMEVFKAGNLRLFNGPMTEFLSSKLNIALLSDYEAFGNSIFTHNEKELIEKYIPWSRKISLADTTYKGEKINLKKFIVSNKDRLILKPAIGYGGKAVYLGKRLNQKKWEDLLEIAFFEKNWLIQEFVPCSPAVYQAGENGWLLHDMVWGFFVLGSVYAGGWVRVLPQQDNKGVINCHQGAKVSVIFQVEN